MELAGFASLSVADGSSSVASSDLSVPDMSGKSRVPLVLPRSPRRATSDSPPLSIRTPRGSTASDEDRVGDIPNARVYVRGLRDDVTVSWLRYYASRFGRVEDAHIVERAAAHRVAGIVRFSAVDEARRMIDAAPSDLQASFAKVRPPSRVTLTRC
jgi:RNA recognition motif-containing protein